MSIRAGLGLSWIVIVSLLTLSLLPSLPAHAAAALPDHGSSDFDHLFAEEADAASSASNPAPAPALCGYRGRAVPSVTLVPLGQALFESLSSTKFRAWVNEIAVCQARELQRLLSLESGCPLRSQLADQLSFSAFGPQTGSDPRERLKDVTLLSRNGSRLADTISFGELPPPNWKTEEDRFLEYLERAQIFEIRYLHPYSDGRTGTCLAPVIPWLVERDQRNASPVSRPAPRRPEPEPEPRDWEPRQPPLSSRPAAGAASCRAESPQTHGISYPIHPGHFSISSWFSTPRRRARGPQIHGAIDFASPTGKNVRAAAGGRVIYANADGGYGYVVRVEHGDGTSTVYAHLSEIHVAPGTCVSRGEKIGEVGATGSVRCTPSYRTGTCDPSHLHFELRYHGQAVDPWPFFIGT